MLLARETWKFTTKAAEKAKPRAAKDGIIPLMSRVMTPQAEKKLADTVKSVTRRGKRYVVRKNGRVVGAIISAKDLERLTRALEDESDIRDTRVRLADPKEIPVLYDDARARIGLR